MSNTPAQYVRYLTFFSLSRYLIRNRNRDSFLVFLLERKWVNYPKERKRRVKNGPTSLLVIGSILISTFFTDVIFIKNLALCKSHIHSQTTRFIELFLVSANFRNKIIYPSVSM